MSFPAPPTAVGSSALRVQLTYWWRHRRLARLSAPRLFTEWVQHRKLNDRDPRLPILADKVLVKDWVAERLGPEWITPTLWAGKVMPTRPDWPLPVIVKSRHGCNQNMVVRSLADHREAVRRARRWAGRPYGAWLDEWLYGEITRGVIVEPFIGTGEALPIDYKIFVFAGVARFVQVHLGRGEQHRWIVFDRAWKRVSLPTDDPDPVMPESLERMLAAAEELGREFPFVRVDFYEIDGAPRFGELTFYPGSGLEPIQPMRLDLLMGLLWTAAAADWLERGMLVHA
ncbi:ATP-grasp fold amidoligase family protein [Sphingomonas swuensis]|uniref:ATP-grasp fold amidoligase family protein n=1 Tax=Sphingomonas swuensis TaxID=977800 RepID=UPI0031E06131